MHRTEFLLDPEVRYLNHGSFGACPRPVFERYQAWQLELEREPVDFIARRLPALLATARTELGDYVRAPPSDLVFVPNATSALNVVGRSLSLRPGDEVLASDLEYGAIDTMWEHLCARAGASYVRTHVDLPVRGAGQIVDAIWAGVTRKTNVLTLSHLTSATALIMPIERLVARARDHGLITVVDGAHAPGQLPLDLGALGADVYAGNCHKWLCAPKGSAFLYARPEAQEWLEALTIGWGFREDATFLTRNEQQGTRDPAAYLTVPEAIRWHRGPDRDAERRRCRELALLARSRLAELTHLEPLAPPEFYGQMTAAWLPRGCPAELGERLWAEHRIEVPVFRLGERWLVRASFQVYNDERDLEGLLEALEALLPTRAAT